MLEIHFQRLEDATPLFLQIKKNLSLSQTDNHILLDEDRHIVKIITNHLSEEAFRLIKKLFCDFILETKCDDWFRRIISDQFYFQDQEEVQQILDIVHSILEGERKELAGFFKEFEHKNNLIQIVDQVMKREISFSFDSFVKFRLRPFIDKLAKYVEISIDEYKMELDYQMFIQTLRDFISPRAPKLAHLHIVMGEDVTFYNDQFSVISRSEIMKMIDRKLLFNHPVYVDSTTIAPLLSISPTTFCLYTKDLEQPLVRTIRNIFEERVVVESIERFVQRENDYKPRRSENK